jgi:hypothetical protein
MKIKIYGEMTIAEIRQVLFEALHEIEEDYAVRFSRGATLFVDPTDGFGDSVTPRTRMGEEVKLLRKGHPYRSAADQLNILPGGRNEVL